MGTHGRISKAFSRHGAVALYVPNIIGYARIVCSLLAFHHAARRPTTCLCFYLVSFVCDELDGRAARAFNQISSLGAVLDMLTDRLSTAGLLVLLSIHYTKLYMLFIALISLDIFSHWLQMYSTLLAGEISHKQARSQSLLVRLYYTHRMFMGACCVSCEVLYLASYLLAWDTFWDRPVLPMQRPRAFESLFGRKGDGQFPVALAVGLAALPGCVLKQFINVAQLKAACQALIIYDRQQDRKRTK